jgi:hypothetical protein
MLVILAKLGGEDGPKGMAEWLRHRIDFLVSHLKLRRASIPHPVTISLVLVLAVDVKQFETLLGRIFPQLAWSRAERPGDNPWQNHSQYNPLGGDPWQASVGGIFA